MVLPSPLQLRVVGYSVAVMFKHRALPLQAAALCAHQRVSMTQMMHEGTAHGETDSKRKHARLKTDLKQMKRDVSSQHTAVLRMQLVDAKKS